METPTTTTQTPPQSLSTAGSVQPGVVATGPHAYSRACRDAGCESCRRISDAKRESNLRYRGKGNPFARPASVPPPVAVAGSAAPGTLPSTSPSLPADPPKPAVPWTLDSVRPIVRQAVTLAEKWDRESLIAEAREVSPQVAAFIAARAEWDGPAKEALQTSGADLAVKWLNQSGISSAYAPEMNVALAILAIMSKREDVVSELRKMAAEAKEEKAKATAKASVRQPQTLATISNDGVKPGTVIAGEEG